MRVPRQVGFGTVTVCVLLLGSQALAGFRGTDLFLPMVGRAPGVPPSNWYTKVWAYNPNVDLRGVRPR